MSNKTKIISISTFFIGAIFFAGCGQKIGGTYTLTQQGQQTQALNCSQITLNLTSSSNQVQATGSNGTCTETLTGTDNGNGSISVTALTMTSVSAQNVQYAQGQGGMSNCVFTGMLSVSGNQVSGTLTSNNSGGSGYGYSYCGTVTINGTKN